MAGKENEMPSNVGLGSSTDKDQVLTWTRTVDIVRTLGDSDNNKLRENAIDITCPRSTFDEMVDLLLKNKADWENCYFVFNNVKIHSIDVENPEDAYLLYVWNWDKKRGKERLEQREKEEQARKVKEKKYKKMVMDSREWKEIIITKEMVVSGLKFIAEHPNMEQEQLISELIKLGCNFTFEDIRKQFPEKVKLFPGMEAWDLQCGASVIANVMADELSRSYCGDRFLSWDYENSIYAFIRKVTGDKTYTKKYVDSLVKKEK